MVSFVDQTFRHAHAHQHALRVSLNPPDNRRIIGTVGPDRQENVWIAPGERNNLSLYLDYLLWIIDRKKRRGERRLAKTSAAPPEMFLLCIGAPS